MECRPPPEYCEGRGHTKVTAWRERRHLAAAEAGTTPSPADTGIPMTTAKVTGAELLRLLRAEADRVSGIADRLREAVVIVTDPTVAEAEVEAVRAAAEARAAAAEQCAAETDQRRAEPDATAEEMAAQLAAAQARADQTEAARAAAETDRDAAIEEAHRDADTRIAVAEAEPDTAIGQARAAASQRVSAAEVDRDQARHAAPAEQAARLAQQEATRAQASADAARAETGRVRADVEKMLAGFRADAARDRDRDKLRADLRVRPERAERQADAYRDELAQFRAQTSHDTDTTTVGRTPPRTRQATQPEPRLAAPGYCASFVTNRASHPNGSGATGIVIRNPIGMRGVVRLDRDGYRIPSPPAAAT